MVSPSNARRCLSGWLIVAILFTQLATAAYACPGLRAENQSSSMAGLPCAEMAATGIMLDAEQPGLCQQHCQFGNTQQPAEQAQNLVPMLPLQLPWFGVETGPDPVALVTGCSPYERGRIHVPAPPRCIALCCYRI